MQFSLSTSDPRGVKAVAIATNAGQWLKVRGHDGSKAYGVPSQCQPGIYYLTTTTSCTCPDFRRRGLSRGRIGQGGAHLACKHILAVRLHCELAREQEASSAPADLRKVLSSKPPLYRTNHLPDRALCGEVDFSGRVCAAPNGHAGAHTFVLRTGRED